MTTRREQRDVLTVLSLIVAAGAILRLWSINSRGLWLDEVVTIVQARRTLPKLVETIASGVHPPLFHILMHFWIQIFGVSTTSIRGYAVMWGVLAIPAAYWAASAVYDRRSGLIAAGITAVSPFLIWYSQEARMYSMMMFFAFMSLGFLFRAIQTNRTGHWIGYALLTLCGMFTHYFFIFLVMGQVLYFAFVEVVRAHVRLKRQGEATFTWRRPTTAFLELPKLAPWLTCMAVLGVSYLLWLNRAIFLGAEASPLVASATGGEGLGYGQAGPQLAARFNDVGRVIVEMLLGFQSTPFTSAMIAAWPLVISLTLVLFDYMGLLGRRSAIALWAAIGMIVIFVLGQWQGQVLASRYFVALAAPIVILSAGVIGSMPVGRRWGVLIVAVSLSLVAWYGQSYSTKNPLRFEYREALASIARQFEPGDVVIYEPFYMRPVILYYLPVEIPAYPFPQYGANEYIRRGKAELAEDLERTAGPSERVWILLAFQDIPTMRGDAYNTVKWFERAGYKLAQSRQYSRVQVLRFDRPDGIGPIDLLEVRQ